MEKINLRLASSPAKRSDAATICGVVGSGNLEVLFQSTEEPGECKVDIRTSARGFGEIWRAVLQDFAENNAVGGLHISINDMGATPAVVSLRLSQGLATFAGIER